MKLRYTKKALAELDAVLSYVAERSPQGAQRVQHRIGRMIGLLADHPHSGQATSEPRVRRLVVTPYPYLVFYELREEEVVVIGIRHGVREP